ncbi:MBL fold metallo-hydrolase [Nocardioides sp.]|uniref:MBL fold metallo-hydrolase n=1 Tax=Nocardioides sp. TaxID=35761 RepID=UPI0035620C1A
MKLTVVGCSGSYPGPDSPASCYLIEADDEHGRTWRILMDLGNGALGALHNYVDPLLIDAVVLSHLHADHCLDLCGYYVMRKYHPRGPQPRIPVYGPSDTAGRMARAYDLPEDPGMSEEFDFLPYDGTVNIGPFTVTAIPVLHPVEAFGLRVSAGGRSLAYTGDTAPCDQLQDLADGVNLLLAEASFRACDDNPPEIHLTGVDCGRIAECSGADRLVITHIPPWFDKRGMLEEAVGVHGGAVELAHAGAVYEI